MFNSMNNDIARSYVLLSVILIHSSSDNWRLYKDVIHKFKHIPKCIEYNLSASSFFFIFRLIFITLFVGEDHLSLSDWESLTYFFWRCNFSRPCLDDRNTDVCIPWHYLIIKVFSFFLSFWIVTSNSSSSSIDQNVFREMDI